MAFVPGNGGLQEGYGPFLPLALQDLAEGQAGVVIDADVDKLPADAPGIALAVAISRNAVTCSIEFNQLFDVDIDHLAGAVTLVTDYRDRWLKVCKRMVSHA